MSRWPRARNATPLPAPDPAPRGRPARLVITDREMQDLLANGQARPLSPIVTSFVHHDGHWWLDTTGEWLAITDPDYAAKLNRWAST